MIILFYRGFGILVAPIWFLSLVAGDAIATAIFGSNVSNNIYCLFGEWLAAAITLALAFCLRWQQPILQIDPETGDEIEVWPVNSFFFIPVSVWPAIFIVLGTFLFVYVR